MSTTLKEITINIGKAEEVTRTCGKLTEDPKPVTSIPSFVYPEGWSKSILVHGNAMVYRPETLRERVLEALNKGQLTHNAILNMINTLREQGSSVVTEELFKSCIDKSVKELKIYS